MKKHCVPGGRVRRLCTGSAKFRNKSFAAATRPARGGCGRGAARCAWLATVPAAGGSFYCGSGGPRPKGRPPRPLCPSSLTIDSRRLASRWLRMYSTHCRCAAAEFREATTCCNCITSADPISRCGIVPDHPSRRPSQLRTLPHWPRSPRRSAASVKNVGDPARHLQRSRDLGVKCTQQQKTESTQQSVWYYGRARPQTACDAASLDL